jgi:hypothetical protein
MNTIKTILKRLAFAMLSFIVVIAVCGAVVLILQGSKP